MSAAAAAAAAAASGPPREPPPLQLALLLLALVLALGPTPGRACSNMELRGLTLRSCSPQSLMRNYDVTGKLTKDCTVNLRACFNVTRVVNTTKINFRVAKPPINKSGTVDWCKEANDLCAEEEKRVGVSCAATRAQGAGAANKKGGRQQQQQQQQQQKRNKFAPVQCPLRAGRRCITHVLDVKDIKPHRNHVLGTFKVSATVDHGPAGSSCIEGSFIVADAGSKSG